MIDRLAYAATLAEGKRVIDIGGARMNPDAHSPFDESYRAIASAATHYCIVDRDAGSDVVVDLSDPDAVAATDLPECDVVLCMETLEHLRNPGVVCDLIAGKVRCGATAYITLPRSTAFCRYLEAHGLGDWWGKCHHLYGFHRHHLDVFIADNFKGLNVSVHACLGRYDWKWPIVWLATLGRGLSWGVLITCKYVRRNTKI